MFALILYALAIGAIGLLLWVALGLVLLPVYAWVRWRDASQASKLPN